MYDTVSGYNKNAGNRFIKIILFFFHPLQDELCVYT